MSKPNWLHKNVSRGGFATMTRTNAVTRLATARQTASETRMNNICGWLSARNEDTACNHCTARHDSHARNVNVTATVCVARLATHLHGQELMSITADATTPNAMDANVKANAAYNSFRCLVGTSFGYGTATNKENGMNKHVSVDAKASTTRQTGVVANKRTVFTCPGSAHLDQAEVKQCATPR
jgi:hypothetical protein